MNKDFFSRSATSLGVNKELERVIAEEFSEDQRNQIIRLLCLFQNRLANLLLNRTFKKFSEMDDQRQREEYLFKKYASSSLALKRTAFQSLKRLILFIHYGYLTPGFEANPNWKNIGYSGRKSVSQNLSNRILRPIIPNKQNLSLKCDICIVGSGAGGSIFAEYLSSRGWKVILLDGGDYFGQEDFSGHQEYEMTSKLFEQRGRATTKDLSVSLLEGRTAGGSTVVNWNTSIKPPHLLLEEWQEEGITNLSSREFSECVDYVWGRLRVNTDESQLNQNNDVLVRGCESLGYRVPDEYYIISRNAVGCTERCTFCTYGCEFGCKQSTVHAILPDAQSSGCRFIFKSEVSRVMIKNGMASEAVYDGKLVFQIESQAVVVAAGSINTPAILLRSGLKNKAGSNLRLHPTTAISGSFEHPINMWEGVPQTCAVTKGLNLDGEHHGYWIEAVPGHPALFSSAIPWTAGRRHKELMLEMSHSSGTIILLKEIGSGRVTIDRKGKPVCAYSLTGKDKDHMIEGIIGAGRILAAAGATRLGTLHFDDVSVPSRRAHQRLTGTDLEVFAEEVRRRGVVPNKISLFSAHIMGTARMGKDGESFCDDNAESHELPGLFIGDASVFPTSPGINPMITIMSMARRNVIRMDKVLRDRNKSRGGT